MFDTQGSGGVGYYKDKARDKGNTRVNKMNDDNDEEDFIEDRSLNVKKGHMEKSIDDLTNRKTKRHVANVNDVDDVNTVKSPVVNVNDCEDVNVDTGLTTSGSGVPIEGGD